MGTKIAPLSLTPMLTITLILLWNGLLLILLLIICSAPKASFKQEKTTIDFEYTLIRPCCGKSHYLYENLTSVGQIVGKLPQQILLGAIHQDCAQSILQQACCQLRHQGLIAQACVTPQKTGVNGKAAQLSALTAKAVFPILVYADSDVDFTNFPINTLLQPLCQRKTQLSLVWVPFALANPRLTYAEKLLQTILTSSLHSFALTPRFDRQTTVGKVFAMRAEALTAVGGWQQVQRALGEDMAMGKLLQSYGYQTHCAELTVCTRTNAANLAMVFNRLFRWLWVVRSQRTHLLWSYPMIFSAIWPLLAVSLVTQCYWGVFCSLVTRLLIASCSRQITNIPSIKKMSWIKTLYYCLSADLLLLTVWLSVLISPRKVHWHGRQLLIDLQGNLYSQP